MSLKRENTTFQAIEETRPTLGKNWKEYWLRVLKPEVITAYLAWLEDKEDKENSNQEK